MDAAITIGLVLCLLVLGGLNLRVLLRAEARDKARDATVEPNEEAKLLRQVLESVSAVEKALTVALAPAELSPELAKRLDALAELVRSSIRTTRAAWVRATAEQAYAYVQQLSAKLAKVNPHHPMTAQDKHDNGLLYCRQQAAAAGIDATPELVLALEKQIDAVIGERERGALPKAR